MLTHRRGATPEQVKLLIRACPQRDDCIIELPICTISLARHTYTATQQGHSCFRCFAPSFNFWSSLHFRYLFLLIYHTPPSLTSLILFLLNSPLFILPDSNRDNYGWPAMMETSKETVSFSPVFLSSALSPTPGLLTFINNSVNFRPLAWLPLPFFSLFFFFRTSVESWFLTPVLSWRWWLEKKEVVKAAVMWPVTLHSWVYFWFSCCPSW